MEMDLPNLKVSNCWPVRRMGFIIVVSLLFTAFAMFGWSQFAATKPLRHEAVRVSENRVYLDSSDGIGVAKTDLSERVEVVLITVLPTGFEPNEINYPNRPFLLAVDNQSGHENLALLLHREDGKELLKIHEFVLSLKSLRKRQITHLKPGRYLLSELNHPKWTCRITITAK